MGQTCFMSCDSVCFATALAWFVAMFAQVICVSVNVISTTSCARHNESADRAVFVSVRQTRRNVSEWRAAEVVGRMSQLFIGHSRSRSGKGRAAATVAMMTTDRSDWAGRRVMARGGPNWCATGAQQARYKLSLKRANQNWERDIFICHICPNISCI